MEPKTISSQLGTERRPFFELELRARREAEGPCAGTEPVAVGTAPVVGAALHRAVDDGLLGYMPSDLALRVREAVAAHHRERLGWDVDAGAVSLLPDVLSALHSVIAHHTRPGSPVIVPTPAYMPFLSIPALHGRQCLQVPALRAAGAHGRPRWTLDLEAIGAAMADGAGLLVLCHPWNPVGRVLPPADLDAVAALSSRYRVPVFADEIHSSLILDPAARHIPYASRPAADPDLTFTATAVSKGWNVPGLKCAQLIASGGARRAWRAAETGGGIGGGAAIPHGLAAPPPAAGRRPGPDSLGQRIRGFPGLGGSAPAVGRLPVRARLLG